MYNLNIKNEINIEKIFDVIILAVAHKEFKKFDLLLIKYYLRMA